MAEPGVGVRVAGSGWAPSWRGGLRGVGRFLPAIIIVMGIGLSFTTLEFTTKLDDGIERVRFERDSQEVAELVNQRIDMYSEVLFAVSGLFETDGVVRRDEYHDFVEADGAVARLPGVHAVEFARLVPRSEKGAFEANVRNDTSLEPGGYPDFSIWPEGDREQYFVIDYIEPFDGAGQSFGFDLGGNETMLQAVERSRDTGVPVASGFFPLREATEGHKSILLLLATYQKGAPTDTASQRRVALQGFVNIVLCVDGMMEAVISPELQGVDLEIYDTGYVGNDPLPPTGQNLMFDSDGVARSPLHSSGGGVYRDLFLNVGGRRWVLHFTPIQPSGQVLEGLFPVLIFAFGSAISLLVGGILYLLGKSADAAESQARIMSAILDSMGEGVVVADENGRLRHFNPPAQRLYGIGPKDVPASEWPETYGLHMPDKVTPYPASELPLAQALLGKAVDNVEEFVRTPNSTEGVIISVTSRPILDETGAVRGAVSVSRDTTEQKRAEEALRRSERLLATRNEISEIFLTVPDDEMYGEALRIVLEATESEYGIFGFIDEDGSLVCASVTKDVLSQHHKPHKDLVLPRDSWSGVWGRALMEEKTLISSDGVYAPEGRVPLANALAVPIMLQKNLIGLLMVGNKKTGYDEKDKELLEALAHHIAPVLCVTLDRMGEERRRKLAEEGQALYSQELARSNADLEQFAYVASHDLQEPLRMVASYLQLLERRYEGKLDSDADEFIEYAVNGAKRMQDMINGLLAYSRVSTKGKEFESVDCEEVLKEAIENLEIVIEDEGATITHDPLPVVMADRVQLLQLLQNLISNGVKFHAEEPPHVHVSAERDGDAWLLSVRDNGIGIEPQYTERVFEMFQRLHGRTEYPGTGIGLAVCRKIVERHNGRIWVDSEPWKGTTVHFTLPADRGDKS